MIFFKHTTTWTLTATNRFYKKFDSLTSLNKHEHYTFHNQIALWVFYMIVTNCLQKSVNVIFIWSDKVVFMSRALCVQPLPGKPMFLLIQKHLLLAEWICIFNKPVSGNITFFCFLQQLWALFIFFILLIFSEVCGYIHPLWAFLAVFLRLFKILFI